MDLLVRNAAPDDAGAIVGILSPIIEAGTYTVFDTPFTTEAERMYILDFPPRGIFHVALRRGDQKLVGFQSLEPFANYTHAFDHVGVLGTYVDLSYRRQGIGRRHAVQDTGDEPGEAECGDYPDPGAERRRPEGLAQNRAQDLTSLGTERHTDPDLVGSLGNRVGHDPVDPDSGEEKSERREDNEQ